MSDWNKKHLSFFYAHSASASPKAIEKEVDMLSDALLKRFTEYPHDHPYCVDSVRVRPGRSDHSNNWKGDWEEWQQSVVHRVNMTTFQPVYDAFVVSGTNCGKATAKILSLALEAKRPVFWWNGKFPNDQLRRVTRIEENDCEDWTNGWSICYTPPKQVPLPFSKEASQ